MSCLLSYPSEKLFQQYYKRRHRENAWYQQRTSDINQARTYPGLLHCLTMSQRGTHAPFLTDSTIYRSALNLYSHVSLRFIM